MLKRLLFACICSLLVFSANAQTHVPSVERSTAFEEPEKGASRLLLMKNGNTLFFNFTPKKGIDVTVYNTKHRAKAIVNNAVQSWKQKAMKRASLRGLYEMNGQAVVFIQQVVKKKPCLYRFIFDANSGKLLSEKLIADLPRMGMGAGYAMAFGGVALPDFYVRKDPNSEYYAVAAFNSLAHDRNERIRVVHYSPDHKEINKAFYNSPDGVYKYLNFLDMYVNKDEFVFITAFAYNTRSSGGKDSRIVISRLMKDSKEFQYNLLDYTDDFRNVDVAMKYSNSDKLLYMLASIDAKSANKEATMHKGGVGGRYVLQMNVIDPVALKVNSNYFVEHPKLDEYVKEHLKYKKPYYGVIQDFNINDDHTVSVMFEELDIIEHRSSSSTYGGPGGGVGVVGVHSGVGAVWYSTRLGEIGITRLDASGKELSSYAIAKAQEAKTKLDMLNINQRPQSNWSFRGKGSSYGDISGFFSYDYVFANNSGYVIYNDYSKNAESDNENYRSKKKMVHISNANTMCAVFDGTNVTNTYLFGDPGKKNESRFSQMEMNTHSEDGTSYATMMIERKGHDKSAYIVWISFK